MGNTSKSKYASQWEEVRKKKKEEEEKSSSAKTTNSSKTSNKYESQWAEVKKQRIANTLNSMLEDYNSSVSSAQDRFKNVNSYRGDTADYLSQVEGYRKDYTTKKSEIDSLLQQYKSYYGDDFIKAVNSTYSDLDSGYESLYKNASADHKYFSQFADENAYKGAMDNQTYSKKYAKSTYADLQKAKADIEAKLSKNKDDDALNRELYWLQNHDRDIQYVDSMSDDDLKNLQITHDSNKKTLEAEKAKLQKEITEIKNKAGRASPESWSGYKEKVARIQEINEQLAQESPVLYYDDVGAVTVSDTLRDREHEVTFNAIEGNADHQAAYDNALEAKANIEELDVKSRDIQEQIRRYETEGHVPDALISELNSVESAIAKNKKVIEDFNSLGYDFNELEHYNRTKESRANYIAEQKKDAEYATEHPVKATLKSIGTAPASIVELVGNLVDTAQYGYSNVYDDEHIRQNQAYQSTVADIIDEKTYNAVLGATDNETLANVTSWLTSKGYSGVTSSVQSALTTGACTLMFGAAGAPIALGIMGTEAAASSYNNAIMNGSTNGEAILTATASGIAEALFEKVSLDKLLDIGKMYDVSSMSALLKSMIKNSGAAFVQGGVEASEEFFTEITNKLADEIINGDHSAYNTAVAKYKKMGYSDADAKEIATKDAINDVLSALYGGFIGGMGSGVGASLTQGTRATGMAIGNEIRSNQYYNTMGKNVVANEGIQDIVGKAQEIPEFRKLANKVAGVNTKELTDKKGVKKFEKQVGKLYKGVTDAQLKELSKTQASETEVNSFTELVKEELKSKGVQNVDKVAEVVVKSALNDGKLTREESTIYNSVNGRQVIHNVLRSEDLKVEEGSALEQVKDEINATRDLGKFDVAKAIKRDLLDKTDYDISTDGVTTIQATDEAVDSMLITSLDGDDITLDAKVGDAHHTVVAGEMSLNQDYAVIFEGLKNIKNKFGLDESTANQILTIWEGHEGDSFKFSKAIEEGLMYGQYNMRTEFENSAFAEELSEETRNLVFEMGREYKQKVTDEKNASAQTEAKANPESKVTFAEGVSYNNLNKSQKAQVDMAQIIAHTFGFNLEVFRSPKNALGRSIGENGSYSASTNTMRLDIDAGTLDGKSLILFTQAHELTHYIKKWSPEKYKVFADFLVEKYAEKDVPLKQLIQQKINESKIATEADTTGRHHVLSFEEAFDEVVCNACEDFLADPDIQQTILEISKVDQGIAQKIKNFIKNLINRLDKALRGLQGQSLEAGFVRGLDAEDIQQLKDLWLVALIDSRENVVQARKRTTEETTDTANEDDLQYQARFKGLSNIEKNGNTRYNKKTLYNEYATNMMQWANSASTEVGDLKILSNKGKWVLLEATENGCIELSSGTYKEMRQLEQTYRNATDEIYGNLEGFRSDERRDTWDLFNSKNRGNDDRNGEQNGSQGIQTDSERDNEHLWTGDKREFIKQTYDSLSSAKNENGEELFQYRAIQHDVPEYRALLEKYSDMSSTQINSLFETMDKAFAIIEDNLEILDYAWDENLNEDGTWDDTVDARAFNPVKPNSDKLYKYSLDFSTMCRKRLLQQVIAEELSLALDRAVTKAEGIAIRNELIKLQEEGRQIEIACALCYVESARMKSPEQIQKFLNDAGQMVREFFATKAKSSISEAEEKARKSVAKKYAKEIKDGSVSPTDTYTTKGGKVKYIPFTKLPKKMKDEIREAKRKAKSSYSPSAEEQRIIDIASNLPTTAFTTAEGLKNLAKDNPVIFDAYTSFVRNATHSKGTEKDVWYRVGDANKIGDDLIAAMNKENGLRSQSWSDFQVIHLLDYVGAIIELSTKKAKMQAYTKVPDYVNLMGLTGQMINLSLIPTRDFNGKLEFDSVEGMAFKVARELRDKYPDTAGTISIGITNEQIQMLLDSMDIDYVIPYHHSAMSKVVRKAMHIPSWVTYQEYQNEKNITSKRDALANAKKYGVQLLKESDENYHKAPNFSEWFDLEEARQVAQLENLNPTDLKAQKKYGVMYGAYKAMQQAADNYLKICAERGLVPKFCHEKADFTVEDNYWKLLIDRKMINQKIGEIIEQKPVQPIFNEGEVLNILNNEIARYEGVKEDFDYATRIVTERFLNGDMNEHISEIAKSIGDTVTNVTKVAILDSDTQFQDRRAEQAEDYFGTTDNYDVAGYITVNGKAIDFSGNKFGANSKTRTIDHREIGDAFESDEYGKEWGYAGSMLKFMNEGNIRVTPETAGIELMSAPNSKQISTLKDYIRHFDGEVIVDLDTFKGVDTSDPYNIAVDMPVKSVEYSRKTSADRIVSDIINYFETGVVPSNPSSIRDFLFQDRNLNEATFNGKAFWSGSVSLIDGVIEEVHSFEEAETVDFHHSLYFSQAQVEKMASGENAFFFIDGGKVEGDWRESIPNNIIKKIEEQITFNTDISFQDRVYNGSLTQERIDYLIKDSGAKFNIGYANTWIASINPSDFIDLTLRYETRNKGREVFDTKVEGDYGGVMGDRDYISDLKNSREIPYLCVDMDTGKVIGHNGRHRMRALEKTGATRTPIGIKFYKNDDLYKGNYDGVRLETIDAMRLTSQFDDKFYLQYNAYIHDIIPLNEDHRDEIEKAYRAKPIDVKYGFSIAYQDRPYQPTLEDLGIDFKEENERLKADVERLQETLKLQGTVTHGKALATKAYEGVAKKLLHEFGMKRITDTEVLDTFVKKLDKFYYSIIDADELAWEKIFNDAQEIAEWVDSKIVEKPKRIDYADEILKEIRSIKISLDDAQMAEVAYAYGSYNAFRKSSFGRINLSNDGIKLDSQWSEWANAYPFVFDADTNSADMPIKLVEIINDLKTAYEVTEEYDKTEQIRSMATSIYDSYWDIPTVRTLADKYQKEVNLLKGKHKAEMDALKEKKDAKLKDTKAYYQKMVEKVRADKDAKMEAYKERTQEQRKKNLEGRTKTATKNKIKRVVKQLDSLYNNPTKEKNVKIDFQDMVNKALIMADAIFDSGNIPAYDVLSGKITISLGTNEKKKLDEWREVYKTRQDYQDKLDALESSAKVNQKTHDDLLDMINRCNGKLNRLGRELSDVVERQKAELNDNSVQNAIDSLVEAYKSLDESTESYVKAAYNDYVATRLETLKESLKGTTAKTMSLTQLDELYQAYKMVLTSVRTANELFVKNKRLSVIDAGESVISEVKKAAKITEEKTAILKELRNFSWQELKPVYAFERIGSQTFMDMYKEVLRGQGVFARDIEDSKDFFQEKAKKYGFDSWDLEKRRDFKLADGRTFSIDLEDVMAIYAYSKREQALDHITDGGFVFDTKEFFTDNREKGLKGKIKKQRTTVKAYRLNIGEFQQIIDSLTKEQKKFVDDMQDYLSSVMGAKGNEVSRVLYGIDLFKEKFYFPLTSSHDFITQTNNPAGEVALKNTGMAKATVPHARNPIVLKGFMDVWSEHVNKMSTYHSFVLPIENLNKVFNYTGYATSDDSVSVETILRGAYGDSVNDYIRTFIQDLNGGVKVQSSGNFAMKAISKFKKTAVSASMSVVIQQPTAIVRALAMMDMKYFFHKTDGMKHKDAWEELKKYAPIAIVKEIGGFDVGGGRQIGEYITAKEYKGIKAKAKGLWEDSSYRDETLMWGASKADEFGWITIWNAVKKEIADTTTLKVGSEEFLQACGERFTEVVDYTQVYDSVISRSGFMRNKGEISKMATAFMGEPTTSFNMLYNAVLQAKRGNIGKGAMSRVIGATMASVILAAIAKSLIYALRDDDDDESYVEKYMQSLTDSLLDELFIPNMLPYVKDVISLFDGWDIERTDMAILKDFKDALEGLDSSDKSLYRKVEDLGGAVAAFGGFPLKNVMRTLREGYNLMANLFDDNVASGDDVGDAIVETITGEKSASDINEALEKGNTAKANEIIKDLIADKVEGGKTEKEAKASIKSSVTGYWKDLYLQAYRDNNSAEMLRIRQILQSTGLYDNVIETCQTWVKSMKDETTTDTTFKKW